MSSPQDRVPLVNLHIREFIAMMAALTSLSALTIDVMLPALPAIGESLNISGNDRQWIISVYLIGFGIGQLGYGTLADRFGRRPVLLWAISAFVLFSVIATVSASFELLLVARLLQGLTLAATRVITMTVVRDCYVGRAMARVMSLVTIVFMIVPMIAPAIGQAILAIAVWRWIFGLLAIASALILIWVMARLPETLNEADRRPITLSHIGQALRTILTDRASVGYTLAQTLMLGGLYGFITSVQQIFFDIYEKPDLFPIIFAGIAGAMSVASFVNSRIVMRVGSRRVSHAALFILLAVASLHLAFAASGHENLPSFVAFQAMTSAAIGLTMGNFSAMAMARLGRVAGTASSIQGCITTLGGTLLGAAIGLQFNGTTVPLAAGFVLMAVCGIIVVLIAERGRLFRPEQAG